MNDKDLPDFDDQDINVQAPKPILTENTATETIDLGGLFSPEVGQTGSFSVGGVSESSFFKLLNALPLCAIVVDESHHIEYLNRRCTELYPDCHRIKGTAFRSLFPFPADAQAVESVLQKVFSHRKPLVCEAVFDLRGERMWARLHLRSVRIGGMRYTLALVQDLTLEKKQLLLNRKHEEALRNARDELEKLVQERTRELREINDQLTREVADRKMTQAALQRTKEGLEQRVKDRTAQLLEANTQLQQEIDQRREAESRLLQSNKTIEALFNATSDTAFLVDSEGTLLALNKPFLNLNGEQPNEITGKVVYDFLPPDASRRLRQGVADVIQTRNALRYEEKSSERFYDTNLYPVLSGDGPIEGVAVFSRDITASKLAQERLNLAANIIEGSNEGIIITDLYGTIVDVNLAFCNLTGYSREEVLGRNPRMMKSDRHLPAFYEEMWRTLRETGHWTGEVWDRRKNGEVFAKLLSISAVHNDAHRITHYVGIFSDITRMKQTEERLQQMAHYDPLTQLPNRLLFGDRLHYALVECGRHRQMVALMLLDLDRFKNINDTLGHRAGDDLLVAVAKRLSGIVRESDTVARLGGDEFIIILSEIASAQIAAGVAKKIIQVLAEPFKLNRHEVYATASMGITLYPSDGAQADRLLQNADMALYRAKEQGKNTFQFFSPEMNLEVVKRLELEQALRRALERQELQVYYQPRVDCGTGSITGAEALLRWNHPTRGLVAPGDFIVAAEETGLIVPIGEWVLQRCCHDIRQWQREGISPLSIAINVSGRQLSQGSLVEDFVHVIRQAEVDPSFLEIELTESVAMEDGDATIEVFRQFKRHGIQVCIDDFGTGYSSLSYLKRFPIDKLKIDKSFVEFSPTDSDDQAIVETILAMAHSLKLAVVAEGVETTEQLRFLQSRNCDEWQGYLCSPPVPFDQLNGLIREGWHGSPV